MAFTRVDYTKLLKDRDQFFLLISYTMTKSLPHMVEPIKNNPHFDLL